VASPVGDIHEVDRLGPGDYDTDGKNGVGNGYNNRSGAPHTPAGVDHKTPRSSRHGINGKRVEDAQLRASFRRLCLQVEERLLGSPQSSFPDYYAFYKVHEILRPPFPEPPKIHASQLVPRETLDSVRNHSSNTATQVGPGGPVIRVRVF
jgi:hypothetical protein